MNSKKLFVSFVSILMICSASLSFAVLEIVIINGGDGFKIIDDTEMLESGSNGGIYVMGSYRKDIFLGEFDHFFHDYYTIPAEDSIIATYEGPQTFMKISFVSGDGINILGSNPDPSEALKHAKKITIHVGKNNDGKFVSSYEID